MNKVVEIGTARVLMLVCEGQRLLSAADLHDLLGEAFFSGIDLIALPVEALDSDFLKLSTGIAGSLFQKFVNYSVRCAIVGDVSDALNVSQSLCDFVHETNRGNSVWFVPDFDSLRTKLGNTR